MIRETLVVGPLQCNCVILGCATTREAVVIDPGDECDRILATLAKNQLKLKYILHTHAHFDHIGATKDLFAATKAPPCLHKADQQIYANLPLQGKMFGFQYEAAPAIQKFLEDGEPLKFGTHQLEVMHTPGHSPGGVCFRLEQSDQHLYCGDSLFAQSIGRTDLWEADYDTLIHSIKDRILTLDDETHVHPGHGPSTKVGVEKRSNPFLI